MNEKTEIEVGKLPIITKFIYTLGVLPTSYLMSMTYQEQVTWLYNYLQTQVIPAINTDVEAVQELQTLYELLRTYVNDYFDNLDVQEEINNKLNEMLQNGELERIIAEYFTNKFHLASLLGMITDNTEEVALSNYQILKNAIESGFYVLIDDSYYIKNTDSTNRIIPISNVYIKGLNKECNLKNYDNHYLYLLKPNNFDIHLDNFNYINDYALESYLILDEETENVKTYFGNILIENSYFKGTNAIIRITNNESMTRDETWGLHNIRFINNHVYNNSFNSIWISNTPYGIIDIIGNTIHNFSPCFMRTFPSNNESISTGSEYLKCINALENNVYNDDDYFSNVGTYACFIETKSNTVIIKNNTIKGIKSTNPSVAVYNCYLSCLKVVFENNICENNINLASNSNNYLMKAKDGVGYRLYKNNKFILDKSWLLNINSSLENPYTEENLLTNTTLAIYHSDHEQIEWKIENNYIDVINIYNYVRFRDIHNCYFNNNIIKCESLTGRIFYPTEKTKIVECCNNVIECSVSGEPILCHLENYENNAIIKVNNNFVSGTMSVIKLLESFSGKVYSIEYLNNILYNKYTGEQNNNQRYFQFNTSCEILKVNNEINIKNTQPIHLITLDNKEININNKIITNGIESDANAQREQININQSVLHNGKYLLKLKYYNDNNEEIIQKSLFELYNSSDINYIKFIDSTDTEITQDITTTPESSVYKLFKNIVGTENKIQFMLTSSYARIRIVSALLNKYKYVEYGIKKIA